MKPYVKLSESKMSDGTVFSLHKHDGKFYLKYILLPEMPRR